MPAARTVRTAIVATAALAATVLGAACTERSGDGASPLLAASTSSAGEVAVPATVLPTPRPQAEPADPPRSPCGTVPLVTYLDLDRGSPHAPAIDCARWLSLVLGLDPELFAPAAPVRRDQMATFVARAVTTAGGTLPEPDREAFSDLEGNVHRDAIGSLAAAGVVGGYGDGTYRPRGTVPRGQMAAFLARAYRYATGEGVDEPPDAFRDDDGHAYEPAIDELAALGIVSGRGDGTFGPDELTSRAGTTSFLVRFVGGARGDEAPRATGGFTSAVRPLPATMRERMTGTSWRSGCPVGLDELRVVELVHRGFDGRDRWGALVVRHDVADAVAGAFGHGHAGGFPVERIQLVDRYGGDDDASMAANNTSGFNCRFVDGTTRWSLHAYGLAVDVNPVQNPYVRGDRVDPPAGRAYVDRSDVRPGMLVRPDPLLEAFERAGWSWGGDWQHPDYQHVSATGD